MSSKNIRATMKWWDPHTKKLKYFSSAKFDEHKNKFGKGWSPGSELVLDANTSTLPTLKIYPSDHPFIKDDIFEVDVNFPPIGTPTGIFDQYCEYHNMSYISSSTKNISWNRDLSMINRTDVWILIIGIKYPTTVQQVTEDISSQKLTVKYNRIHFIPSHRDKNIVRHNLQENISILNKIRHIQAIGNKIIFITEKPTTPDHIGGVIKTPLKYDCYDSISSNYEKMEKPTTFSATFLPNA